MIKYFEKEAMPLSEYERETLLPIMIKCLRKKTGKEKAITNEEMCEGLEAHGYKAGEARIRKIINHIRNNNLINCLMATNCGYYVSNDVQEIKDYVISLEGRIEAISAVKEALIQQLRNMPGYIGN